MFKTSILSKVTLAPRDLALPAAIQRASLEISHAVTLASGSSNASVMAIQPLPVPMSSTLPQSGTTFRLRGKGVPHGGGRGDQYVTVLVETPRNLNQTQIDALKRFDATLTPGNYGSGGTYAKAG